MQRELKEGRGWERERDLARRGARPLRGGGRAVQGRARGHRRGRHLPLHAVARRRRRLHRPLPRAAPAGLEADQGAEADRPRRRVLARRRAQQAADAHLRHRVLRPEGSRPLPRAARAGEGARPSSSRRPARPLPSRGSLAGLTVLAPQGHGGLERARGSAAPREPQAWLSRGEDAAALRRADVRDVGASAELRGEHLLGALPRRERPAHGAQADELPGPHAALRLTPPQLPGPADSLRRVVDAPSRREGRNAARPAPGEAHHAGRRAHLRRPRPDRGRDLRLPRLRLLSLRPLRHGGALRALDAARTRSSAPTRSGTSPRARCAPRSIVAGSTTT